MPYINEQERIDLRSDHYAGQTPGELNYAITQTVLAYIDNNDGLSYASINAAIGALECAKLELYRRLAAPYEDEAIERNGDLPLYALLRKEAG